MKGLNAAKGYTISELEATFALMEKLIEKRLSSRPDGGIILCKGKPNETRISYAQAKRVLDSLQVRLSQDGCFSFNVCKTCTRFRPGASAIGYFGTCGGKIVHEYDSCEKHSKYGGGYGL